MLGVKSENKLVYWTQHLNLFLKGVVVLNVKKRTGVVYIQSTLLTTRLLGLAKLPLYNRNVVRQQNKETQSRNEIPVFTMDSL